MLACRKADAAWKGHSLIAAGVKHELEAKAAHARSDAPWPRVLLWFWAGSAAALVMTVVVGWLEYRAGWPQTQYAPLQYFNFSDLLEYRSTFQLVHTAAFFHPATSAVAYPPFGAAIFGFVYAFGNPVRAYLLIALLALGGSVWGLRRTIVAYGLSPRIASPFLVTLVLASFPFWRMVPQGNIELFLWIFTATGVWLYLRGHDDAAAVVWALAAATKLYPIIFLVLFLPRKKYRAFFLGVAVFVGATVASLAYLGPTIAVAGKGSLGNVFGYQGLRADDWTVRELVSNHSWFMGLKILGKAVGVSSAALTKPYYLCGAILFAAVYFGRVRKMPVTNQIMVVSLFMVLLPPVSYFHTLANLYAAWFLLAFLAVRAAQANVRIPGLHAAILLFLPLFSSFSLYSYPRFSIYGGVVQSCVLTVLFVWGVWFPFGEPVVPVVDVART